MLSSTVSAQLVVNDADVEAPPSQLPSLQAESGTTTTTTTTATTETTNSNNYCNINNIPNTFIVRMNVNPFVLFSKYRITPIQHQTRIPQLVASQQLQQEGSCRAVTSIISSGGCGSNNSNSNSSSYSPEQIDEWKSMWQQVHDLIQEDNTMQEITREQKGILGCYCMNLILLLGVLRFIDTDNVFMHTLFGCDIIAIIASVAFVYMKHYDPNRSIRNEICTMNLSVMKILTLIGILLLASYLSMQMDYYFGNDGFHGYYVLVPTFIVLYISFMACIPILIAFRNRFYFAVDRHDKVLKKIYFEMKQMNASSSSITTNTPSGNSNIGLSYFTLHPKVNFDGSNIIIDIYHRTDTSGSNINEVALGSSSLVSNQVGVSHRRNGGGTNDTQQQQQHEMNPNDNVELEVCDLNTPLLLMIQTKDTTA